MGRIISVRFIQVKEDNMGYKRKIFGDKTIVAAAAVGVMAISAIVGGVLMEGQDDNVSDKAPIVDLSDEENGNGGKSVSENTTAGEDESGLVVSDQNDVKAVNPEEKSSTEKDSEGISEDAIGSEGQQGASDGESDNEDSDEASGLAGINFDVSSILVWPVEGNILIDYDMENTVYFATLDLYKCSDAVCIQSEVGTPVYAGYAGVIEEIAYNTEIGNNVTVSMGNGYMLTYGQLKDVQIDKGDVIEEGDLIGYIGNPSKYYTVEGANLYMKMTHDGTPVDPLDYLNYEE